MSSEYVKTEMLGDREILTIDPKALELLAENALADVSFMLRSSHLQKLKKDGVIELSRKNIQIKNFQKLLDKLNIWDDQTLKTIINSILFKDGLTSF